MASSSPGVPSPEPLDDLLEVLDDALSAALREIRRARARSAPPPVHSGLQGGPRTSQVDMCKDILIEAGRPLHATALVEALVARGVAAQRDSLVSALTKRRAPRGPFVRTAPNTFGLAGRDIERS